MAKHSTKQITIGKDVVGVGVGAAIQNTEGKFLLAQRGPKARNERGKWEIPGGSLEFGETFEQAIKREVKEELGIEIEVVEMLQLCDHILPDEQQHWISPTYLCRITAGTPQIMEPEKCSQLGWYTLAEAEQLDLSDITKHDVAFLLQKQLAAQDSQTLHLDRHLAQIVEFHHIFDAYYQTSPSKNIPPAVKEIRKTLIKEEAAEVCQAIDSEPLADLAKELADLLYVLLGTVTAFGLQDYFSAVFDEVHASNMSKVGADGKLHKRADGKILKPPTYRPADLSKILPRST